jgi:transcriptional regulator with XRE-family HTH domain
MNKLRQLLALNIKGKRHMLGLSQAKLAEKVDTSTQYIAMIELEKKFPSPEMLERIAAALEIDAPELFSMPPSPAGTLRKLHETVLLDIEHAAVIAVTQAARKAVEKVVDKQLKNL